MVICPHINNNEVAILHIIPIACVLCSCIYIPTLSVSLPLNRVIMVLLPSAEYVKYMHTVIVVLSRLQILSTCEEMLSAVMKCSDLVTDTMSSCRLYETVNFCYCGLTTPPRDRTSFPS